MTNQPPAEESGPVVLYERGEGFATITLNRPDVLNAINGRMQRELYAALGQAVEDDEVRSVILRGAGRTFSAGGDMNESSQRILDGQPAEAPQDDFSTADLWLRLWSLPKPTIAAVHGHAVGFACEIAGICDITIAAEDARLGEIQIRHGYGPPVLITPFLLGIKQAKEVMMLGDIILAPDAQRLGLVNRVVPADRLWEEAETLAKKFAALPPAAVAQNKRLINRVHELRSVLDALDYRDSAPFGDIAEDTLSSEDTKAHLRRLREQGWEAFKSERDSAFGA